MLASCLMKLGRMHPLVRGRTWFFLNFVYRRKLEDVLAKEPNPVPMRRGFSLFT